jgi:transposase, IS5 family
MPKQMTFAALAHATRKKVTQRERFLAEMEAVMPWARLIAADRTALPEDGRQGYSVMWCTT